MEIHRFFRSCLGLMLSPVARFCISRGIRLPDFVELAKKAFVQAAIDELSNSNKEISTSKISVMTGIQRPEVKRLHAKDPNTESKDLITRLVGQWVSDKRFLDRSHRPKRLSFSGLHSEFAKLVALVSKEVNPHTIRFELERLGIVEVHGQLLVLKTKANISGGDPLRVLRLASEDMQDLLSAAQQNAFAVSETPHLHARTEYDNIPDEHLVKIRKWFLSFGQRLHAECRSFLSQFDRDINPQRTKAGGRNRVVIGTFSFVQEVKNPEEKDKEES